MKYIAFQNNDTSFEIFKYLIANSKNLYNFEMFYTFLINNNCQVMRYFLKNIFEPKQLHIMDAISYAYNHGLFEMENLLKEYYL